MPSRGTLSRDFVWGANGHPFNAYPDISMEQQLDLLVQAGLKQYRVNLAGDDSIDRLDTLLSLAAARGVTVLPIMFHQGSLQDDTAESIYARSRAAAEIIARRFAGRVKVWELDNELENYAIIQPCEMRDDGTRYPCSWGPAAGVGELEYYGPRWRKVSAALHGLSDGVRAGDPAALRAVGTAGWGHLGAFDRLSKDGVEWEISVWHQYTPWSEESFKHIAGFGKPIWLTEYNFSDPYKDDDATRASLLRQQLDRLKAIRAAYRIEGLFFYELLDEPYWDNFEGKQGLYRQEMGADGKWRVTTPKPSRDVARQAAAAG